MSAETSIRTTTLTPPELGTADSMRVFRERVNAGRGFPIEDRIDVFSPDGRQRLENDFPELTSLEIEAVLEPHKGAPVTNHLDLIVRRRLGEAMKTKGKNIFTAPLQGPPQSTA